MQQREIGNNFSSIDALSVFDFYKNAEQLDMLSVHQAETMIKKVADTIAEEKSKKLYTTPFDKVEYKKLWSQRSAEANLKLLEAINIALPLSASRINEDYKSLCTAVDILTQELGGKNMKIRRVGHSCASVLNGSLNVIGQVKNIIK